MALNQQVFKTRTITAIVFAAVMLTGLFLNAVSFTLLCLIILIGCAYEFIRLTNKIPSFALWRKIYYLIIYILFPILCLLTLGFSNISFANNQYFVSRGLEYHFILPCAVIFSIWINDTMAYIVGSMIGKTPLSPISPKKTWEGTIGGALLAVIVIGLLGYFLPIAQSLPWYHWIAIAAVSAVFGTFGDLFESKLKRLAGVKDSGNFMPGHGGFLDRFDSLLFAAPAVWAYCQLFLN